jgi:CRISPR/Cas system-associated protein Csm6
VGKSPIVARSVVLVPVLGLELRHVAKPLRRLEEASATSIQAAMRGKAARGELERRKAEKAKREEEERRRKEEQR